MRTDSARWFAIVAVGLSACATLPESLQREQVPSSQVFAEALREHQELARRLEREGRLRDSLIRWKIVLAVDPEHAEARRKSRELEPRIREQAQRHLAAGKEHLQRRDRSGAQREFLAALRLEPQNREALALLYRSEEELGEQSAFARPVRKGPVVAGGAGRDRRPETKTAPDVAAEDEEESGEEVSFAEAAELFRSGDYLAAIDAFSRVLSQQPGLREALEYQKLAYYNQGLVYMKREQYADALKMFERLRRIQADFKQLPQQMRIARDKLADQHNVAGIRFFKEHKLKEAIDEWEQALALNPRLESARRSQERAKRLLKSLEEIK